MPKKGVLLVNLGSPDSFSIKDIKRYLKEFLMDEYVIDLPYLLRYALVCGIILNTRPPKTSKAYQKIWWDEGSSHRNHQATDSKNTTASLYPRCNGYALW